MRELIKNITYMLYRAFGGEDIEKLEKTIAEYKLMEKTLQETIAAGWDYPKVTIRLPKPRDIIPRRDIRKESSELHPGKYRLVIEDLPDFWIGAVQDTLSQDPFYGIGHNFAAFPLPQPHEKYRHEDLAVGDLAIYQVGDRLINHQIVKIERDEQGRIYTFRGFNTIVEDPYQVRNEHIKDLVNIVMW